MKQTNIERATKKSGIRVEITPVEITQKKRKPSVSIEKVEKITFDGEEIEQIYGVDAGTLANYRSRKEGCRFYKVKRRVLYRKDEFENWLFGHPVLTIDSMPERPDRR